MSSWSRYLLTFIGIDPSVPTCSLTSSCHGCSPRGSSSPALWLACVCCWQSWCLLYSLSVLETLHRPEHPSTPVPPLFNRQAAVWWVIGTVSIRPKSNRIWINRTSKTASCLATYFVCASAGQADQMWAMLSGAVPHNLHVGSLLGLTRVLWMAYNRVDKSCSYNSNIPATLCVGHVRYSLSHQKHRSVLSSSSSSFAVTNFPCHFWAPTSPFSLNSCSFLRWVLSYSPGTTSPSSVTQAGSGYFSFSCRPYSSAYFAASFVSDWCPTISACFSKSRTIFITGSLFWKKTWLLL